MGPSSSTVVARGLAPCIAVVWLFTISVEAKTPRHYVFFGHERAKLAQAASFFEAKRAEGAQVRYPWHRLEPRKDVYDLSSIRHDLALLTAKGKRLFIQLQA